MNAKTIEGLKAIREGIDLILAGYAEEPVSEKTTPTPMQEVKSKSAQKKEEIQPEESVAPETVEKVSNDTFTREQLDGMTYNDLKKLAKSVGVSATGNREDITNRILGDVEPASEEPVKKIEKVVEPEEVEVDEKDVDPLYAKVVESLDGMDNEDIADILADVGISAKGKREALIEKVVQAVRDGLIEFDDDEEETEEEVATVNNTSVKPVEESDEEEDITNDIENPDMTEARRKAIIAQDESIRKQFKKGEVTRDNLVEFLQSFYDTDEDMEDMSDDEILDTYIDAVCRLVDDDGDLVEEGAYTLNGEPACCGRVLSYSEDTGMFICEHCGEEYEAEE